MANLTLKIDEDLLRRARIRALERATSVNAVVREFLEGYAGGERETAALQALQPWRITLALRVGRVVARGPATRSMTERSFVGMDHCLSLWDALIVRAAAEARCNRILSEDLQDGTNVKGVRVDNPFRDA